MEEGIANVVLEAMALGTLVVSSNCGGMEEVVRHQETGFIFPLRNVPAMIDSLENAINLLEEEYNAITLNARHLVEKQHSLSSLIMGMQNLYNAL